jgi:hypothetical protein
MFCGTVVGKRWNRAKLRAARSENRGFILYIFQIGCRTTSLCFVEYPVVLIGGFSSLGVHLTTPLHIEPKVKED